MRYRRRLRAISPKARTATIGTATSTHRGGRPSSAPAWDAIVLAGAETAVAGTTDKSVTVAVAVVGAPSATNVGAEVGIAAGAGAVVNDVTDGGTTAGGDAHHSCTEP